MKIVEIKSSMMKPLNHLNIDDIEILGTYNIEDVNINCANSTF